MRIRLRTRVAWLGCASFIWERDFEATLLNGSVLGSLVGDSLIGKGTPFRPWVLASEASPKPDSWIAAALMGTRRNHVLLVRILGGKVGMGQPSLIADIRLVVMSRQLGVSQSFTALEPPQTTLR